MVHVTDAILAELKVRDARMHFVLTFPAIFRIFFAMDKNIHIILFSHHVSKYVIFYKCTESPKLSPKQENPAVVW